MDGNQSTQIRENVIDAQKVALNSSYLNSIAYLRDGNVRSDLIFQPSAPPLFQSTISESSAPFQSDIDHPHLYISEFTREIRESDQQAANPNYHWWK